MTTLTVLEKVERAREALLEKKGVDVVVLDVQGLSTVTDYYLIATGNSSPHLKALVESVEHALKGVDVAKDRKAGRAESGWIASDYLDFVIHVLSPELREYYALEQLWKDGKRLSPPA